MIANYGLNVKQRRKPQRKDKKMPVYLKKKAKPDNEETTLLGAQVPNSVSIYLSLFCIADGITKSSIIAQLINKWHKKAKKKFSEKDLIELIAKRGWIAWKERKNKKKIFSAYIKELEREIRGKLPPEMVSEIIQLVKNEKSKEDKE